MVFYIAGMYLGDTGIQKLFPDWYSHWEVPSVIALGMWCGEMANPRFAQDCNVWGFFADDAENNLLSPSPPAV